MRNLKFYPRYLLLIAPFVLLAPVWLAGKALYWGTPAIQFIPWWWQAWLTLRAGEWPLWNPLVGLGAPLLANYQSALFYPPTWIYFGLAAIGGLPLMAWGQAILVALHLAWAGWGMGRLIQRLGHSELAQTVGGLAFSLSGYLVARAHFLSINSAVAWLPWILLAAYNLAHEPRKKRNVLFLALALSLQWFAGHAQLAWYTLLLATAWTVFWAWRARAEQIWKTVGRFALACSLAFALSAVQLLPTIEYLQNSQRAVQVDFAAATAYSFWPYRALGLLAPNAYGNPATGNYLGYGNFWEDAIYIGILPLVLAIGALLRLRKPEADRPMVGFLFTLIPVSIVLALGSNTPVFEWLYKNVPSFALFQSPTRFSIWLVFSLALLAAISVDRWRAQKERGIYWARLGLAAAVSLLALSLAAVLLSHGVITVVNLQLGLVATAAAWLNLKAQQLRGTTPRWNWLVLLLLAADLLYAGWGLNPGTDLSLYQETGVVRSKIAGLGEGRLFIPTADEARLKFGRLFKFDDFFSANPAEIRASLLPDITLLEGIASANNFDPLVPRRYRDWIDTLEAAPPERRQAMLAAMGVTLIEYVSTEGHAVDFEPLLALPRARWVDCAVVVETAEQALQAMDNDEIRVEMPVKPGARVCGAGALGVVELRSNSANRVTLRVDAPGGGWLLLADTWYPDWQASVDGKALAIYPANELFRAVRLDAGSYQLEFNYQPASFFAGLTISVLAWFGLGLTVFIKRELV